MKKKKQTIHDYKIIHTYPKNNPVTLDYILSSEEFKKIVREILIKYS